MNKKRIILFILILTIVGIILFPILYMPDNIGISIKELYVKKGTEIMNFSSIINSEEQLFIVFFSYECSACKKLLDNKSVASIAIQ